ncbi:Uu.00g109370.m01.CDS01 [Anthostomella pinea]|uniref:Uu.00g109370.m01.CDS01 n=1 Tax=Anthostomella pinea TaxID=933095 RepID=A0AAI8VEQ9_9PEZI|nr:Uu.00g109370.m01.CDS01 [Anthostomella pinea]
MDSGSYNNVRRGTNPLPPMSSTPDAYKANVNRTKTKKWVEAKMQSYDGDDWGNDYDDEYDEPEPEEPPPPRTTGFRQPGQSLIASRTFSQPAAAEPHMSTSGFRSPSGPFSVLHTNSAPIDPSPMSSGASPGGRLEYHPITSPSPQSRMSPPPSAPTPQRFPPRNSSMSRQDAPDMGRVTAAGSRRGSASSGRPWMDERSASPSRTAAPPEKALPFVRPSDIYRRMEEEKEKERMSIESGRPSLDSILGRGEGTSSPANAIRLEQRRRTSFESHDGSESTRGLKPTLAPVAERKSEYGMERLIANAEGDVSETPPPSQEQPPTQPQYFPPPAESDPQVQLDTVNSGRISTSPKLPDVARMSGFGDDFFSTSTRRSSQGGSLQAIADNQKTSPPELGVGLSDATPVNQEKQPPSVLEGPSHQPNTDIIIPMTNEKSLPQKDENVVSRQQQTSPRPTLPGTWVTETGPAWSEAPTPMERSEGLGQKPLASVQQANESPSTESVDEPADMETTTEVKQQSSAHDDAVASQAMTTEPNHHPTPHSLPPLKTDDPLVPNTLGQISRGPPLPVYQSSPVQYSPSTQPTASGPASKPIPTAPLNPLRSGSNKPDMAIPTLQERKPTLDTVGTASPEKESDKLREEIMRSLSASPATPGATGLLNRIDSGNEPTPGGLTRESTYLSGVYDDYLTPAEEKSLQETGQAQKQEYNMATNHGPEANATGVSSGSTQKGISIADIAPLSPKKSSPELQSHPLQKRFSWEQGPERVTAVEAKPSPFLQGTHTADQANTGTTLSPQPGVASPPTDGLHVQTVGSGTLSHQVSQVSSRAPEDGPLAQLEPPSPISYTGDKSPKRPHGGPESSQLSLAEEKEQMLDEAHPTSLRSPEQHPALSQAAESPVPVLSPLAQEPAAQTSQQPKILTFREILNIGSTDQRIQSFEKAQSQFFVMESGLSNWLMHLQNDAEHDDATSSGSQAGGPLSVGRASPSGMQRAAQQPYYQQYLNASNPGNAVSQPGRSSTGNLQLSGQQGSTFGSSGGQVGTKSKELLHAAGSFGTKGVKSGMKLFNKGKSKLRERTGEKVFF